MIIYDIFNLIMSIEKSSLIKDIKNADYRTCSSKFKNF